MLKFNKTQLKQICRIMQKVIRNLSQKFIEEMSLCDLSDVNNQNTKNDKNVRAFSFKTEEVNFFNLYLTINYNADDSIIVEKDVYF